MSISDRIYTILADGTKHQDKWIKLVGEPSSSLILSKEPADEYCEGITLDEPANTFQARLAVYGNVPMSTFSILA